jgi:chromosome partitioning protein
LRTLAVIALKGGSGKTTVATHLALAAHLRGLEALVLDTDPQQSARDLLGARKNGGPECMITTGAGLLGAQFAAVSAGKDLLIIDTPAGAVEDVTEAIVLADMAVMVARPTLLDLAGLVRTLKIVRRLDKPYTVVVNQAPIAREGTEAPVVRRALQGLEYMRAPIAPSILRSRVIYQTALETGRSVEEMLDKAAAAEVATLWDHVAAAAQVARTERTAEVQDHHP